MCPRKLKASKCFPDFNCSRRIHICSNNCAYLIRILTMEDPVNEEGTLVRMFQKTILNIT